MAQRILRLPDVIERSGLSRATIYALKARGEFPPSVKISTHAVGWLESDINDWLSTRIKLSSKAAHCPDNNGAAK
jgi:prophage regulatory protein